MSFFPSTDVHNQMVHTLSTTGQWEALRLYLASRETGLSASARPYYPPPPPPPPDDYYRPPRATGIDWKKVVAFPFKAPHKKAPHSKHPMLFKMYVMEFNKHPERFTLSSEGHHSSDGRYYFSIKFFKEGIKGQRMYSNFHIFGRTDGYKFMCESVDILMGDENYVDAVVY
ncbi:MAG: hypothetical protein YSLV5_ORF16 [Yellowstone Lake virophage 5]|uniref:Uncharacterized protein n=1 Tax=Yellowstone Lake virophage 5 TaxID=1557033 RepID=A0A0A0RS05_9VIRU|nr:MAG: hypothetical protein ASQ69_gp16 [Yellowstone Lake virophage 5]AIW01874.1 MAG: hypothetical protein YSLV5_ORF16 [Yellowstone Lake virophage 5]